MATTFEDTFDGAGSLFVHVSNSGHNWGEYYPSGGAFLSGGYVEGVAYANTVNTRSRSLSAWANALLATGGVIVLELQFSVAPTEVSNEYTVITFGLMVPDGSQRELFGVRLEESSDFCEIVAGGSIHYGGIAGWRVGISSVKLEVDFPNQLLRYTDNGVVHAFAISGDLSAYDFVRPYINAASSLPMDSGDPRSLRFLGISANDGESPPVAGQWWTNIIRATEIP